MGSRSLKELLAPVWQAVRQRGDVGELRFQVAEAQKKNAPNWTALV
ncbi:hypothetical protein ACWDSD_43500 [Streptomyces spiralis]